jgi:hypothetical protein
MSTPRIDSAPPHRPHISGAPAVPANLFRLNSALYISTASCTESVATKFLTYIPINCIEHPRTSHKDGLNSIYFPLHDDKSGPWGRIKNLNLEFGERTEDIRAKAQEEADALGVQMAFASLEEESTD